MRSAGSSTSHLLAPFSLASASNPWRVSPSSSAPLPFSIVSSLRTSIVTGACHVLCVASLMLLCHRISFKTNFQFWAFSRLSLPSSVPLPCQVAIFGKVIKNRKPTINFRLNLTCRDGAVQESGIRLPESFWRSRYKLWEQNKGCVCPEKRTTWCLSFESLRHLDGSAFALPHFSPNVFRERRSTAVQSMDDISLACLYSSCNVAFYLY